MAPYQEEKTFEINKKYVSTGTRTHDIKLEVNHSHEKEKKLQKMLRAFF